MKRFTYIFVLVSLVWAFGAASCDVHEFPYPVDKKVPFVLHLNYSTDLPLHKVVEFYEESSASGAPAVAPAVAGAPQAAQGSVTSTRSGDDAPLYDVRYIVVVDTVGQSQASEHKYRFVFTRDEVSSLDNSVTLELLEGRYNFTVWTDYVLAGSDADHHYSTARFEEVLYNSPVHIGCDEWKDAFNGSVVSSVSEETDEAFVDMGRPLAKYNFIATDVEQFVMKVQNTAGSNLSGSTSEPINWKDYKIVFNYKGFVPYSFNLFTDKPADSRTNISFESHIRLLGETEAEIGFDYVFVHDDETFVTVSVAIYDKNSELVSQSRPIDIPLMRSKLTTVKADFFTSYAGGGVTIVPDFDGEHNLEIK